MKSHRRLLARLLAFGLFWQTGCGLACATRVLSENLCADQLLLGLASPSQIAGLSSFSRNRSQSFLAKEAASFPFSNGSAEDILQSGAELVLVGPYDELSTRRLLSRTSNIRFKTIDPWRNLDQGYAQIRAVAHDLGHVRRGERLIKKIRDAFAALAASRERRRKPPRRALVLGRGGYAFRGGALWQILRQAGFRDIGAEFTPASGGFLSLESVIAANPDYLIILSGQKAGYDAFLDHPALRSLFPPQRRMKIPERLAQCDGPSTPSLIAAIAAEGRDPR